MLGWCSGFQTPESHKRCVYELVVSEGVHRGKLMVCECECHEGRSVDYSKYPENIQKFNSGAETSPDRDDG